MADFVGQAEHFDVIVVGLGGHGSAALAQLATTTNGEKRILGIEQFTRTHGNGSSHGRSRIYRQAYFEHPGYVPLLQRSLTLWYELRDYYETNKHLYPESEFQGQELLSMCGGLMIGKRGSEIIEGTLRSIEEHSLPHQIYSAAEIKARYPVFDPTEDEMGIYEDNAGYLHPELCIESYVHMAMAAGAQVRYGEKLLSFTEQEISHSEEKKIVVELATSQGRYTCDKLILSVGVWAPELYGSDLNNKINLWCERRVLYWFKPRLTEDQSNYYKDMPIYIWDLGANGNFYGFPEQRGYEGTAKVAMHFGKLQDHEKLSKLFEKCQPHSVDREVKGFEVEAMRSILDEKMPTLNGELDYTATCMYTMTPDQHFLIDFHPKFANKSVVLASPCSGHGFKFCSVIGEILKDLALDGETKHNISFFSINDRLDEEAHVSR